MRLFYPVILAILGAGFSHITLSPAPALGDVRYSVQSIPLPADISSTGWGVNAVDLNDRGEVVGDVSNGTSYTGYYWNSATGQVASLHQPAGGQDYTHISAINNQGLMAGQTSIASSSSFVGAAWTSPSAAPFVFNVANCTESYMLGVNNNGQVTGYARTSLGQRAILWSPAQTPTILPPCEPPTTSPRYNGDVVGYALNDAASVVGYGFTPAGQQLPMRYNLSSNNWTEFAPVSGMRLGLAIGINNSGLAVGYSGNSGSYTAASLWDSFGVLTDLRTKLPAYFSDAHSSTYGRAINDQGVILIQGQWQDANSGNYQERGWLYNTNTGIAQCLNDSLPASYALWNTFVTHINNRGQIIGSIMAPDGTSSRNVLLTPYPVQTAPITAGTAVRAAPTGAGVDVTFANVAVGGTLVAHAGLSDPVAFAAQFLDDPTAMNVLSTSLPGSAVQFWTVDLEQGSFDQATVTFTYDPSALASGQDENALQILHFHAGTWETLPVVGRDLAHHEITVTTTSFSPFILAVPEPASIILLALGSALLLRRRR